MYSYVVLVLDHRLDYALEQSMVEYFSAITSHQAYWHNLDFAKFVLYHVYESDSDSTQSGLSEPSDSKL